LALAHRVYQALRDDGRFELLEPPQLSVVGFRLRGADEATQRALLERVNARRRVLLSSSLLHGRILLRVCVLSFRTHLERIDEAIAALREEASALLGRNP